MVNKLFNKNVSIRISMPDNVLTILDVDSSMLGQITVSDSSWLFIDFIESYGVKVFYEGQLPALHEQSYWNEIIKQRLRKERRLSRYQTAFKDEF